MRPSRRSFLLTSAALLAGAPAACNRSSNNAPADDEDTAEPRFDLYGDPLPKGAIARLGTLRFRHGDRITALDLSPDGKIIASASSYIKLWDAATGKELRKLVRPENDRFPISAILFSPDGKLLIGDEAKGISFWDVATGKHVSRWHGDEYGSEHLPAHLVMSPDSRVLALAKDEKTRLYDVASGKVLQTFEGGEPVALSPDGRVLATASHKEKAIFLWDAKTGKRLHRLSGDSKWADSLAFSPDNRTLASTGVADRNISLWNVATGELTARWPAPRAGIQRLMFMPDGKSLVSEGWGERGIPVTFWDTATGKVTGNLMQTTTGPLALSRDGRTLVTAWNSVIRLWRLPSGKELHPPAIVEGSVAFSGDGKKLVTTGMTIRQWKVATGEQVSQFPTPANHVEGALSPDGKVIALWFDEQISLREVTSGKEMARWRGYASWPMAFSPDSKFLAMSSPDQTAYLVDAFTGKQLLRFVHEENGVGAGRFEVHRPVICFSPDGKVFALVGRGPPDHGGVIAARRPFRVYLWDVSTGKLLRRLCGEPDELVLDANAIAFSPDGKFLAAAIAYEDTDNRRHTRLDFFAVATGERVFRHVGEERTVLSLAFSPDGKVLFEGDDRGTVRLWDITTGKEIRRIRGHQDGIFWLGFSPDGKLLATASNDTTALIWDTTEILRARPPH